MHGPHPPNDICNLPGIDLHEPHVNYLRYALSLVHRRRPGSQTQGQSTPHCHYNRKRRMSSSTPKRHRNSQHKQLYFTTSTRRRRSLEALRRYRSSLRWERGCGWRKIKELQLVYLWFCLVLRLWGMLGLVLFLVRRIGTMMPNLARHRKVIVGLLYLCLYVLSLYRVCYRCVVWTLRLFNGIKSN